MTCPEPSSCRSPRATAPTPGRYEGVACLGAVIRGETTHYDYVCGEAAAGIARVQLDTGRAVLVRRADGGEHGAGARAHGRRQAPPGRGRGARRPTDGGASPYAARLVERVNLFSDTQTRPTDGMRRAIAEAEVGDEQRFADPTTTRLQERVAELLGHEAALFLPSGTMCNQIAIRLHIRARGRRADRGGELASRQLRVGRAGDVRKRDGAHDRRADRRVRAGAARGAPSVRPATATRRGRGSCPSSRRRTWAAAASGRSRRCGRCSRSRALTRCARTWTARG